MIRLRTLSAVAVLATWFVLIPATSAGQSSTGGQSVGARLESAQLPRASMHATGAINEFRFTGQSAGEESGNSVASAGDVNGDGYDDIIVGAAANDAGGADAGRAYLFFGSASPATNRLVNTADRIVEAESAGDLFGTSVSGAGDMNGDGYADFIVGAPGASAGGTSRGRAYVLLGGANMDAVPDLTLSGVGDDDSFGHAVAAAGDVNGDGFGDVIVGTFAADSPGADQGAAYIFFGGASLDSGVDVTLTGVTAGDWFGNAVAGAGDINGDGFSDVLVGSYLSDANGGDSGAAYAFFGGSAMDTTPDGVFVGEAPGDQFGFSVAGAGDVNADGYDDLLVGAVENDAGGSNAGRAYIFHGGVAIDTNADVVFTGREAGDNMGSDVASVGDVNGDGFPDVVVGAERNDDGGNESGQALVFFGAVAMDVIADVVLTGEVADDRFGGAVASAGDIDGDGYPDILIGARLRDAVTGNAGRSYVYTNQMLGNDVADYLLGGAAPGDLMGSAVAAAGDVNGDGFDDVIVGAHQNDVGGSDAGRAYIYFGGPGLDAVADVVMTGADALDNFGWSVASAGDVNGDGFDDVIVGAPFNDDAAPNAGRAYVFYGGASMDGVADVTLTGEAPLDQFGQSVGRAGDVNGDGFSDVVVGAPFNDVFGSDAGRAYVYYGAASMDNAFDVSLSASVASEEFGASAATAGDLNNDGFDDVIVGAPSNDDIGTDAGKSYVFLGGAGMGGIGLVLSGESAGDLFGRSVSGAGDVNGDGFDDVVVGASGSDAGGSGSGRAYVFFGDVTMDVGADVVITGQVGESLGFSVGSAGDVNGDGVHDVVVGAHAAGSGRALVFFGGPTIDGTADLFMIGESNNDALGTSVSSAGDVNGDGIDDVLAGAPVAAASTGWSYVFLSTPPAIRPYLLSVADVPDDQGAQLQLAWTRSGFDYPNVAQVASYTIERSPPPGQYGFLWEDISTVSASHLPIYGHTGATPSNTTYFFRIRANGAGDSFWRSGHVSGTPVDNLAPVPPQNAMAIPQGIDVRLVWDENTYDPDVREYNVHRSTIQGFTPSPATLLAETVETELLDDTVNSGMTFYYVVTTEDINGNESLPSTELTYDPALPVELSSFAGYSDGRRVHLRWTVHASGLSSFVVEAARIRAGEYEPFAAVTRLSPTSVRVPDGVQTSVSFDVEDYGAYAFRLRHIEPTGAVTYGPVVHIEVAIEQAYDVAQIYPNPVSGPATLTVSVREEQDVTIALFDASGREIGHRRRITIPASSTERIVLQTNELASGVYFVMTSGRDFADVQTIVIW